MGESIKDDDHFKPQQQWDQPPPDQPKRKMRGPPLDLNDILDKKTI
jgi:hypothetical protein